MLHVRSGGLAVHDHTIYILFAPVDLCARSPECFTLRCTTLLRPFGAESQVRPAAASEPARPRVGHKEQGTQTDPPPHPSKPAMVDAACSALIPESIVAARYAKKMGLYMGKLSIQEWKWWQKFSACLRMPRGGMQRTGSQACSFEYSVPSDRVLSVLMEGLPFRQRQVWESGNWVPSKTIDTFYALDVKTLDTYLQLHRRDALKHMPGFYRGSRLISPADSKLMCVLLCIVPPMLFEVCHRSGNRVELVASFKLFVYNDLDAFFRCPPTFSTRREWTSSSRSERWIT